MAMESFYMNVTAMGRQHIQSRGSNHDRNIHLKMEIWPEAWGWITREFPAMIDRGA